MGPRPSRQMYQSRCTASPRRFGIEEPRVLVGGVVDDKIENDANVVFAAVFDQTIEVFERPVGRVDILVVRNVIAKIDLRRREARRDPDCVDAELLQIVELRCDPVQITHAVIVTVGKAARVNFIEDGMLPPGMALGINRTRCLLCDDREVMKPWRRRSQTTARFLTSYRIPPKMTFLEFSAARV